jgi:hypothetical protein
MRKKEGIANCHDRHEENDEPTGTTCTSDNGSHEQTPRRKKHLVQKRLRGKSGLKELDECRTALSRKSTSGPTRPFAISHQPQRDYTMPGNSRARTWRENNMERPVSSAIGQRIPIYEAHRAE